MPGSQTPSTRRTAAALLAALTLSLALTLLGAGTALAQEVVYGDTERKDLTDPGVTYVIRGDGPGDSHRHAGNNYFYVPEGTSSKDRPLTIVLDNVNYSQKGHDPSHSFIDVCDDNYVIVRLRGTSFIESGEQSEVGDNDGMSAISVREHATLKITSDAGDGSEDGSLEAIGGGGKYGGAGIGRDYNFACGTLIIAGGTIDATGGHCAAGIGSGRDGQCKSVTITGGNVRAQGGEYAAGIGAGDNVATGEGGDLWDITITGGTVSATGGGGGAGIGGSEGGNLHGTILIAGGTVTAQGGQDGAGIGAGDGGDFEGDASVTITGGTVTATGGSIGAGIGGGNGSDHVNVQVDEAEGAHLSITAQGGENGAGVGSGGEDCERVGIRLDGGTITARGGANGAGIGGANDPGVGSGGDVGTIEIFGTGTINAYGGSGAAAIGAGYKQQVDGHITIEGDRVGDKGRGLAIVADSGGGTAAGIGSGAEGCGPITIRNATVTAWGDGMAADIGTGGNRGNGGSIDHVTIENCRIDTKGHSKTGAGIGAGWGCECKSISIKDSECYGNAIGEGMGVYFNVWFNAGDMDSITIENSTVEADWDSASTSKDMKGSAAAGIGSCTLGSVGSISIKNSTVTAKGINGGAGIGSGGWGADDYLGFEYIGGEVGSITIERSYVDATGAEPGVQSNQGSPGPDLTHRPVVGGGAGIGGGGNTPCGTVSISDNSKVLARGGKYAAGIGGGGSESVSAVVIQDSEVDATGGQYGAGIGSGGSQSAVTQTVFHADVDTIRIANSTVTARGGKYGAGIGCGCGAAMDTTDTDKRQIDYNIHVSDSTVEAQGGEGGAGIGGGMVGAYAAGGHSGNILLEGTSEITATGGRQGAGVGGGAASDFQGHGGCDKVVVDLASPVRATLEGPEDCGWLMATGGLGAAGIGAGGYLYHNSKVDPIPNTNDTEAIEIRGGYVRAKGGADDTDGAGIRTGSGAGIGGGAAGTRLKSLNISGGWVEAHAGDAHAADIGHGGNTEGRDGTDDASNRFYVCSGTLAAGSFGKEGAKVFDGGSFCMPPIADAKNSSGTPVFRTTLQVLDKPGSLAGVGPTYGGEDIYLDDQSRMYLYLPESAKDEQKLFVMQLPKSASSRQWDYLGTTTRDGQGWLKMKGNRVHFASDTPFEHYGDTVTLTLTDDDGIEGAVWPQDNVTVSGPAEFVGFVKDTSPGMQLQVHVTGVGSYQLSAFSSTEDDPLYWGNSADYWSTTIKGKPEITVTHDPSKTYDGLPMDKLEATTTGPGEPTVDYLDPSGNVLDQMPVDAGRYKARISVPETPVTLSGELTHYCDIWSAPTETVVSLAQNGATATATAQVCGLVAGGRGTVTFQARRGDEVVGAPVAVEVTEDESTATATFGGVPAGDYTVTATFEPADTNHARSEGSASGRKDLATRTIAVDAPQDKTYGDGPFDLSAHLAEGGATERDAWSYEVVWDSHQARGLESCVSVSEAGRVSVNHAGTSYVKVTLSDGQTTYNDAVALVRVHVAQRDLKVTSYVHEPDGDAHLRSVTYGDTEGLQTDLAFAGLREGDTPEDFTHGHGTLAAAPLPERMGVTKGYRVPIMELGAQAPAGDADATPFASRDYAITYAYDPIDVTRRPLAVQALDASGDYGAGQPDLTWDVASNQRDLSCEGLAAWDNRGTVFTQEPTVSLEGDYEDFDAGSHPKKIHVAGGTSANYDITYVDGTLVVRPVEIGDTDRFALEVEDATYDGHEHRQPVTVHDEQRGADLSPETDFEVVYGPDVVNAGDVHLTVVGRGNYAGHQAGSFRIGRASIAVKTDGAEKGYDGSPLTAPGTASGIVGNDATFEVIGSQTEAGASPNTYDLSFASERTRQNYAVSTEVGVLRVLSRDISGFAMAAPDNVVYDGTEQRRPVTITASDGTPLKAGTDYTLAYEGDLANVGTVTVRATGTGNYTGTRSCTYEVVPAPLLVDTSDATKAFDGTPLTQREAFLDGLRNGETATVAGTGTITRPGTTLNGYEISWDGTASQDNYVVDHVDLGTLTVTAAELSSCTIARPADVTYDGREHPQPTEIVGVDGTLLKAGTDYTLAYAGNLTNVGTVTVTATATEGGDYRGDARTSYDIVAAPTQTVVTLAQRDSSATATATVLGLVDDATSPGYGTVSFAVDGRTVATRPVERTEAGAFVATATFDEVAADVYTVVATYVPASGNHTGSVGSATGAKDLATRTIAGETTYGRTFGDPSFDLALATDSPTDADTWTFEVTWDAAQGRLDPAVSVDEDGRVSVLHAGSSVIRVTLSDGRARYDDAVALVRVDVARARLTARSHAWRKDAQGLPEEVGHEVFGDLAGLSYGIDLTVERDGGAEPVGWEDVSPHVLGTIEAVPVEVTAGVGTHEIEIALRGRDVEVGGRTARDAFGSRDFDVHCVPGSLEVTRRPLAVRALDATGTYGDEEPAYDWVVASDADQRSHGCEGLAAWDSARTALTGEPAVTRDTASLAEVFSDIDAGTYEGALRVSGGTSANYAITYLPGDLTVEPADISDAARFAAQVGSTTYDGREQRLPVTLTDTALDGGRPLVVSEDADTGDAGATYPTDTTNAGTKTVSLAGRGNYTGARKVSYAIEAAPLTVATGSAAKVYDGSPLTEATALLSGLVAGETARVVATGAITDAGTARNAYDLVWDGTARQGNYRVAEERLGTLEVARRPVTVTADNKRRAYGEENPPLTYTEPELVGGDTLRGIGIAPTLATTATGESRPGTYPIEFEDPVSEADNYDITYVGATLLVTRDRDTIVVSAKSASKVYDGEPLTEAGYAVSGSLAAGDRVTDVVMSAGSALTGKGSAPNHIESYRIVNAAGTDVTKSYSDLSQQDGRLVVTARPVTFVADSDLGLAYTGTEQRVSSFHVLDRDGAGLVAGHTSNVAADGRGTLPGLYRVSITRPEHVAIADARGADVTANYDVRCVGGLMRIAPVATPIRVTAASAKREYDGTPLADARFSYNQGALVAGDALEATVEGSATHVGDAGANVVTSVRVMRGDLDVTGAYTLAQSVPGRLEVTPRALTVATGSASKAFDGTPLTAPEARLEGLVAGETATVVATGSLTLPGSARNGYDLRWDGTAREADYEVTEEDLGTLTVTAPTAVSYRYAGVADPTWTHGQTTPLTLTYKRSVADETTLDHFTGIRVDGTEVDARWYATRRGSVVIDLSATFLEGLATGSHEAMALFDDGTAPRVTFHVRDAGQDTPVVPVVPSNPPFPFVPTTPVAPHGPWLPPVSPYAPVRPSDPGQPSANGDQRSPDSPASPAAPTAPAQPTVPPTTGGTDGGATTSVPVATEAPASDGTGSATVQSTSRPATKSAGVTRSVLGRRPSEETDDAEATVPQNVPATSDAQGPGLALALAGCGAVLAGSASRRWRRE